MEPTISSRRISDWEMKTCACNKCHKRMSYYDPSSVPPFGKCFKTIAYDEMLRDKVSKKFNSTFSPASNAQVEDWMSWLKTPDAISSAKRICEMENASKKIWGSYRFDPVEIERHISNMWPDEYSEFKQSLMWYAYTAYSQEQHELLNKYNNKSDCSNADDIYTELNKHIRIHGKLICELHVKKQNLLHTISDESIKIGRRASRRVQQESDKNSSERIYSQSELRRLARGETTEAK